MGETNFDVVVANEFKSATGSTEGIVIPELSSNPSTLTDGELWLMDTGEVGIKTTNGITELGGTASTNLDSVYNGGATATVDSGAVTLTDTQTGTGGALLITKSGVVTGASSASVFHINSTGAHDTSGTLKLIELSMGSETAGTPQGLEVTMNADSDDAVYVTKGSVEIVDGDFTASSVGRSTTSGFTVTTANTSGDGMTFNIDSLTSGDGFIIDGDATGGAVNYFCIQEGSSNIVTITDDDALFNMAVEIDFDDAKAFLITQADDTEVLSVDTTQDAADTTVAITSATTSGVGLKLTASTTTGNALEVNADSATSGNGILVSVASGTMNTNGAAISVIDSSNADREIFAVRDDGTVYVYGTGEGTTAQEIGLGDLVITDGDLTVSGGNTSLTSDDNASTLTVANNTITTANALVDVSSTSISTGALTRLNANTTAHDGEVLEIISAGDATSTPKGISVTLSAAATGAAYGIWVDLPEATTGAKGIAVRMDKITTSDMLYLDAGGATMTGAGRFINCNDDDTSKFSVAGDGATVIAGTAAGTAVLTLTLGDLVISDTDTTTITSVDGTGSIVEIISGGAIGADKACLEIDASGTFNANGSLLRLSAENVTATNSPFAMQIDCAALDMGAINIVTAPTTNSALVATTTGALAADKAVVELISNASACNADSAVLRLEQTHTTGVATCLALKQDDLDIPFITLETTIGVGNAIEAVGAKSLTTTHFVMVDIEGVGTRYFPVGTIA